MSESIDLSGVRFLFFSFFTSHLAVHRVYFWLCTQELFLPGSGEPYVVLGNELINCVGVRFLEELSGFRVTGRSFWKSG